MRTNVLRGSTQVLVTYKTESGMIAQVAVGQLRDGRYVCPQCFKPTRELFRSTIIRGLVCYGCSVGC